MKNLNSTDLFIFFTELEKKINKSFPLLLTRYIMKYLSPHLMRQQNIALIGAEINEELMVELHAALFDIDIKLHHR